MGRPRKKERHKPTNLTLDPKIKRQAMDLAFEQNKSLSELVGALLEDWLASANAPKSCAKALPKVARRAPAGAASKAA